MKRQIIFDVACELFAKKGYDGCSIQDIADKVGLHKATLYNYIKSKDELFLAVLEREIGGYEAVVQKAVEDHYDESLEEILFAIVIAFTDYSSFTRLLLWKKTLLMTVCTEDKSIRRASRELLYEKNMQIFNIVKNVLIKNNMDINSPKVKKLINSYYIFLMSVLEWMLLNEYRMQKNFDIMIKDLWYNFWNGCKLA